MQADDQQQTENLERIRRALPIDIFMKEVTYLPFGTVQSICQTNRQFRDYCLSPNYSSYWKSLIESTYRDSLYQYNEKVKEIQEELTSADGPGDQYNYMIYVKLSQFLDPVTQVMILLKQGDTKSLNNYTKEQIFLAKFLLGEKSTAPRDYRVFNDILDKTLSPSPEHKRQVSQRNLDYAMSLMASDGNIRGIRMLQGLGANVLSDNKALEWAAQYGHLEAVKYLLDQGVDINIHDGEALTWAAHNNHLELVRYLISRGADVNNNSSRALLFATIEDHFQVVKTLTEAGSNIPESVLKRARELGRLQILKYLTEAVRNRRNHYY